MELAWALWSQLTDAANAHHDGVAEETARAATLAEKTNALGHLSSLKIACVMCMF